MKIVTFNINSIRKRLHQLQAIIDSYHPDIICLQETKVDDDNFPTLEVHNMGYGVAFYGQKTHYGVATLSRTLMDLELFNFADDDETAQPRSLLTRHQIDGKPFLVFNGYFPQGDNRSHPTKFPAKKRFYENLVALLKQYRQKPMPLFVVGDFNIAPDDRDVGIDTAADWLRRGDCSFLPEERQWYEQIYQLGFVDCWRECHPKEDQLFSWFNYRTRAFERTIKKGLRIDHILIHSNWQNQIQQAGMDYTIRAMPSPSDHVPVWVEIQL